MTGRSIVLTFLLCGGSMAQGIFEGHADIGTVKHPGSAEYDSAKKTYTVTGSGANIWAAEDDFQFVWKKVSGDVSLAADVEFAGTAGNAHRKAALMIRRTLDQDSDYVDAAVHGNGLTSLQFRNQKGGATHEVQVGSSLPKRVRIAKQGDYVYMWTDGAFSGGSMKIGPGESFYVGIGVCAHDPEAVERAMFSNVDMVEGKATGKPASYSTLEVVPTQSTDRRAVYVAPGVMASPSWSEDGKSIVFESNGHLNRIPAAGGKPEVGEVSKSVSPDGTQTITVSGETEIRIQTAAKVIATLPGGPGSVGPAPWSPDSKSLVFVSYHHPIE